MSVLCYLSIFLFACAAQATLNQRLAPLPYSIRATSRGSSECGPTDIFKCSDCTNIQKCNNGELEFSVKCIDQNPTKPYCDSTNNECVASKDRCLYDKSDSLCPSEGLWPDLTDCKKYISCPSKGANGIAYNCLFASIYSHVSKRCITGTTCYTVTAECGAKNKVIAYGPDKHLYVICKGNNLPELRSCSNDAFIFNTTSMLCEFQCPSEGNFAHSSDNNKFYVCVKNGNNLVKVEQTCPVNSIFNGLTCVKKEDITTTLSPETTTTN